MYIVGQSKDEALQSIGEKMVNKYKNFKPTNSPDVSVLSIGEDVRALRTYHNIQIWCGRLMANMRLLDNEIDSIFSHVIKKNDRTFSSKRYLNDSLKKLFVLKESIRNIEIDVKEFVSICATTEFTLDSTFGSSTLHFLNQLNSSFVLAYDLVIYKLKSISDVRVTMGNILISLVALGVSLMALFGGHKPS